MLAWLTAADFADLVTSYWPGTTLAVPFVAAVSSVAASIDTLQQDSREVDQPQPLDSESTAVEKRYATMHRDSHKWVYLIGVLQPLIFSMTFLALPKDLLDALPASASEADSYVVDLQSIINGATTLFAFGFTHLHTRNTSSLTRNHALRTFLVTGTLLFRLCRTLDLLSSADRAAFAHSTTEMLRKPRYDIASTWCCFCQGLVCGHLHPPTPVYSRFFFVLLVVGSVVIPPLVAYVLTGLHEWLVVVARQTLMPSVIGVLIETLHRRFFLLEFTTAVRNQQAIALAVPRAGRRFAKAEGGDAANGFAQNDGQSVAEFEPLAILGFGATGQVRLVRDKAGKLRALKSVFKTRHGQDLDEQQSLRVAEERTILQAVHDHPFIIKMYSAFEDESCFHFVLQHAAHGTLSQWLSDALSEDATRLVAAEITSALSHLHEHEVLYRDLKPENVLVDGSGHILLADFGVSKRLQPATSHARKSLVGTPGFIAPEIVGVGKEGTHSHSYPVDWWSLGVLVMLMLTLEEPFDMQTLMIINAQSDPGERTKLADTTIFEIMASLSSSARSLVRSLLRVEPADRLGTKGDGAAVRAHPFFASIDWAKLARFELPAPFPALSLDLNEEKTKSAYGKH